MRKRWSMALLFLLVAFAALTLVESFAPPLAALQDGDDIESFVPSEELPVDSAVSFPVDI